MFMDSANRVCIVIVLIWMPTLQGKSTLKICDNVSRNYSRSVNIEYSWTGKTYDYCYCTLLGSDSVTIHTFRAGSPAVYCPSTLSVNNRYYNCSANNGLSGDYRKVNETLHPNRATTVTLIINSPSNPPVLRMEFKGKSDGKIICNGRSSLPRSPTIAPSTVNITTTARSQVSSESTSAFPVSTEKTTITSITQRDFTHNGSLPPSQSPNIPPIAENNATTLKSQVKSEATISFPMLTKTNSSTITTTQTVSGRANISETSPIGLATGIGVGVGALVAVILTVIILILCERCVTSHRAAQSSNIADVLRSQPNATDLEQLGSDESDHIYITPLNDDSVTNDKADHLYTELSFSVSSHG